MTKDKGPGPGADDHRPKYEQATNLTDADLEALMEEDPALREAVHDAIGKLKRPGWIAAMVRANTAVRVRRIDVLAYWRKHFPPGPPPSRVGPDLRPRRPSASLPEGARGTTGQPGIAGQGGVATDSSLERGGIEDGQAGLFSE